MIRSLVRWIKGDKKPPKYFTIIKKNMKTRELKRYMHNGKNRLCKEELQKFICKRDTSLVKIDLNNIIYNYNSPKLENEQSNGLDK